MHDPQKAARDLEQARAMVLTPAFEQYTQDCLALSQGVVPPPEHLFEPTRFIDPALPAAAARVLARQPEQEQLRLAVQVALQMGTAPEAAERAAPHILDAARNLHRR